MRKVGAAPYKPVTFNSESLSQAKLQQMANNMQWLFENNPRVRYLPPGGSPRDAGLKIMYGKAPFPIWASGVYDAFIYFGSFFSAGCKPIVTTSLEVTGSRGAKANTIRGLGGEIDYRGFVARVFTVERPGVPTDIEAGGWIHWQAAGY